MKYFSPQHWPSPTDRVGGKAHQLFQLLKEGLSVPAFAVIPAGAEVSSWTNEDWQTLLDQLGANDKSRLAVRSSAMSEDGSQLSFAGQFASFLNVSPDAIADHVRKVQASAESERVAAYQAKNNLPNLDLSMAVIVQTMVSAEVAGVAFGIEPVSGHRKVKIVSAVWGLGEGLVSGELDADTYRVENELVVASIATKKRGVFPEGKGVAYREIPQEQQKEACLSDVQVLQVAQVLEQLHRSWGRPQDVEFAFAQGQLWVLQARPITHQHRLSDPDGAYIVWDNSNIIESYPGVTTPLTFSFILRIYAAVYRQLAGLLGVSPEVIAAHHETFENMLGLINGRVYYNLLSWYRLLAMVPGYELNAAFMEKMMGVKERFELPPQPAPSKFTSYLRIARSVSGILKNLITLPRQRRQFLAMLNRTMAHYESIDLHALRPHELMELDQEFEEILLKEWKAPLVNDFFAMIFFGTLEKLLAKWAGPEHSARLNDLLIASEDIISVEPARRLSAMSQHIQQNPQWQERFETLDETELIHQWKRGELQALGSEISEYIHRFGERCVGELKLETRSYRQDPIPIFRVLKGYATLDGVKTAPPASVGDQKRQEAEQAIRKAMAGKALKKRLLFWFLRQTRTLVSSRENLRFERTRAFGMVRALFTELGRKLWAEGQIDAPQSIFYLTRTEIFDHIKGTSVNGPLQPLIELRQKTYREYEAAGPTAERIVTRGMVYQGHDFFQSGTASTTSVKDALKGIGACPGIVKAQVRVVQSPSELNSLQGDILVTASTDPGWVLLFPSAGGILVERGSQLSHSAIVSREMGIPCVVGITGLLQTLKTGDWVEMDGTLGTVKRIETPSEA